MTLYKKIRCNFKKKLQLPQQFLSNDPASWADRVDSETAEKSDLSLKVVNDHAERCVALIQRHNKLLIKTQEQKKFLDSHKKYCCTD